MILSSALVHLYIHRGFVRLNVSSADQLSPHRSDHRDQQLADFEDPAVQRRSADLQADVSFQNHALPMQWGVIAVLADDRVNDDTVARQALLDDPWRQWCRTRSTRGRLEGNSWRPGCLQDLFVERRTHGRSLSACSRISLTTGSSANNCICACESFSPPAPYFSIRISRSRSSSTRILSSAYCSRLFNCAMSSRSAGAEGMGGALTMSY